MSKYYLVDLGVRNDIIDNFQPIEIRNDKGALWENYLFIERQKYNEYNRPLSNYYFWRLYSGAELDYLEDGDGALNGFEFKWKSKRKKGPKTWLETYDNATFDVVDRESYYNFIGLE